MKTISLLETSSFQMKHAFFKLRESSFVKNVLIIMSGTAIAQAISFALLPVISRLFTPEDFGIFGSFTAVANVVAAGATLDYSQAIMLPKDKNDAFHLFFISCLSTLAIVFICTLACLIAPGYLMGFLKTPTYWLLVFLVFAILAAGINVTLRSWSVRVKAFKHISTSNVIRSLSNNGMRICLGIFKTGSIGLIISSVLADLFSSINLLQVLLADYKKSNYKISRYRVIQLAKEYCDFPLYSASQNVINAISAGIPVILLTYYFSIAVAGYYAFGTSLLTKPMSLITGALRQVLFQKASETQHAEKPILSLFVKTTSGLFAIGLLPALVIMIWAPQIFILIFGSQWLTAGEYARWLILWMLFVFCNVPAVLFARLIRIQRMVFFYNLILLAVRVSSLVIGGLYLTALQSITLFSIIGASMNLILILLVGYNVMKKEGEISWKQFQYSLKNE